MISDPLGDALAHVRDGGLLAYPTETVWGLGVDARSDAALERLRAWKGRDDDAPVSILLGAASDLVALAVEPLRGAQVLASEFWPGPLTLVVQCAERFARGIARSDGAVGLRCSSHPLAAALARRLARDGVGPLTATSLNRSGDPSARRRDEARALCGAAPGIPHLLDVEGAEAGGDRESTVVDLTGVRPVVVRWGGLSERVLGPVLEEIEAA